MLSLLALPADVLLAVRDTLALPPAPGTDPLPALAAHLALAQTARALAALYAFPSPAAEHRFWRAACARAGLGRPLVRARDAPVPSWKDIARRVVAHRRVCEIRSCRDACVWSTELPHAHAPTSPTSAPPPTQDLHPLYFYLHFSAPARTPDRGAVLSTLLPTYPDCTRHLYAPLAAHAPAACALATRPPVRALAFVRPPVRGEGPRAVVVASVRNPDGCTLLDVNRVLADILPRGRAEASVAAAHYRTLRTTAPAYVDALRAGRHRGVLGDHTYPYLEHAFDPAVEGEGDETDEWEWDDGMQAAEVKWVKEVEGGGEGLVGAVQACVLDDESEFGDDEFGDEECGYGYGYDEDGEVPELALDEYEEEEEDGVRAVGVDVRR
ncbi:hypothetical protein DENSPDRAFT_873962 [Dentipellis sp. KUC8613]|nr:hypothetical protein DENSPDRAFT_873962 [Dentipellis sp. KUC8613]